MRQIALDTEMARLGRRRFIDENKCNVVDTLTMARKPHPGLDNDLNTLSDRYRVDCVVRAKNATVL